MAKKKTTQETVVFRNAKASKKPTVVNQSTNEKNVSEETRSVSYGTTVKPVENNQVPVQKKRVRDRHKKVKKLSVSILCATTGFQRFS